MRMLSTVATGVILACLAAPAAAIVVHKRYDFHITNFWN